MQRRRWEIAAGILLGLLVIAPGSTLASSGQVSGAFATQEGVSLSGMIDATQGDGIAHLRTTSEAWGSFNLSAEQLKISYTEMETVYAKSPTGLTVFDGGEPHQRHTRNLTNVSSIATPLQDDPELLAMYNGFRADVQARSTGANLGQVIHDRLLVHVETSNESVGTDEDAHGFSYRVEGTWASLMEMDRVNVTGTFNVFVNNLTLEGDSDQGPWEHWTGRQEDPHPGGASGEARSRVTLLHVTNGTLTVSAEDLLRFMGPQVRVDLDGAAAATGATGRLDVGNDRYEFKDGAVDLAGSGGLHLAGTGGQDRVGGMTDDRGPSLLVEPQGTFEVDAPGTPVEISSATASQGPTSWLPWALLLVVGAAAGTWALRTPAARVRDKMALQLRERRVSSWLDMGDRMMKSYQYDRAASWYQRIVDNYPEAVEGWHSLGQAREEAGDHAAASEAYERTARLLEDDAHLFLSSAKAALAAEDPDRAAAMVMEVAVQEEELARQALADPELAEVSDHPVLRDLVDDPDISTSYT